MAVEELLREKILQVRPDISEEQMDMVMGRTWFVGNFEINRKGVLERKGHPETHVPTFLNGMLFASLDLG